MLHLLIGRRLKGLGGCDVTRSPSNFGEITVLDVRHRLAGKGGLKVFNRDGCSRCSGCGVHLELPFRGFSSCDGPIVVPC